MNEDVPRQIVDELLTKRLFTKGAVEDLLNSRGVLGKTDVVMKIIIDMVRTDPIYWTEFITDKVPEIAECGQDYVNLLAEIGSRNLNYLLCRLTELCECDATLAVDVYKELDRRQDRNLSFAMGYVLGGVGMKDLGKVMSLMDLVGSPKPHQKIAYVLALHIAFQSHPDALMPDKYAEIIIEGAKSSEQQLRSVAIQAMLAVSSSNGAFFGVLKELAATNDIASWEIASMSTILMKTDKRAALELLKRCAESGNDDVVSNAALSLGGLAPEFPVECLQIVKRWTRREEPKSVRWSDYLLDQIGKGEVGRIGEFMREWIEEEDDLALTFKLPDVIWGVYKANKGELLNLMHSLDLRYSRNKSLIVETLERALSELYGHIPQSDEFVEDSYELLVRIAGKRVRIHELKKQIGDKVMLSLATIREIKLKPKALDRRSVEANLPLFPNIRDILGKRWLQSMLKRKGCSHPLIILLSDAKPSRRKLRRLYTSYENERDPLRKAIVAVLISNQFHPGAFLSRIDTALGLFNRKEQGMRRIVNGLKNEDEFSQTVSELDIAAQLRKRHSVVLQYKVGSIPVDIKATINGREYLIEVYCPDTELRLKYVRTPIVIPNRAKERILKKIDEQLKHIAANTTIPLLLAIDKSRAADIDEIDVLDALKGSLSMRIAYDKTTGALVGTQVFRKRDSITSESPYASVLSGVVLVKRGLDMTDRKMKLYGKVLLNEQANIHLDECEVSSLEGAIFEQPLY